MSKNYSRDLENYLSNEASKLGHTDVFFQCSLKGAYYEIIAHYKNNKKLFKFPLNDINNLFVNNDLKVKNNISDTIFKPGPKKHYEKKKL